MANSQSKYQVVVHSNPCECEPPHARPKEPPGLPGYPAAAEPGPDQTVPTPGCRLWFPAQVERGGDGGGPRAALPLSRQGIVQQEGKATVRSWVGGTLFPAASLGLGDPAAPCPGLQYATEQWLSMCLLTT